MLSSRYPAHYDETVYRVKGREMAIGLVVDGQSGRMLGVAVLVRDGNAALAL